MVPIYICEDNEVQRQRLEKIIQNYIMINQLDSKLVFSTESSTELATQFEKKQEEYAIVFLDIEISDHERSGIELAQQLKTIQPAVKIIFISSHDEFALDIHKLHIEAYDFIQKADPEIVKQNVEQVLADLLLDKSEQLQTKDIVKLTFDDEVRFYPLSEIQYFCTIPGMPHKLEAHLTNETFQFYGKLKNIMLLNESLVRSHRAYVVNIDNIRSINKKDKRITLSNGEKVPVSVTKLNSFL